MEYKLVKKSNKSSHSGFLYIIESTKNKKKYIAKSVGDNNEVNIFKHLGKSNFVVEFCNTGFLNDKEVLYTRFSNHYITLEKFIKRNGFNDSNYYIIFNSIIKGINFIHSKKVGHRDIKPSNLLIRTDTYNIKYIDFELSCIEDNINQKYVGTRQYASPFMYRIVKNKNKLNFMDIIKSDYFSIGIIFYELVTNTTPYSIFKNKNLNIEDDLLKKDFFLSYIYDDYYNKLVENKYNNIRNLLDNL